MVHSQQLLASHPSATIPVTLQAGEEVVEGGEEIVVDCKVELDGELEVEWEVPALPFHRFLIWLLLSLFMLSLFMLPLLFLLIWFQNFTTGSILASQLSASQRDLMCRK